MAAYIEIRPDDEDLETDIAQPSTSAGGARIRRSDSYTADVPLDVSMEYDSEARMTHNEDALASDGRSNGKKQANHVVRDRHDRHESDEHKEPEHGTEAEMREFEFCVKTPISDGPIIDLRGREVLFAIGVFFFLSVSIGLIVVLATDKISAANRLNACYDEQRRIKDDIRKTCVTKECLSRAAEILDMMDGTASPCQDFWRYSCGGWLDKAEIPPSEKSWGVDKELTARIHRDINTILTSDVSHCNQSDCAERKMKIFYRECMDLDRIDEIGTRQILNVMDHLGGWALFDDWNLSTKPGRWNLQNIIKELHHVYLVKVFFEMRVRPDEMAGGMVIQFDQSELRYPDVFTGSPQKEKAYLSYLHTMAKLFGASTRNVAQFVNETWQFEKELAELHMSEMDMARNDPNAMYNSLTIAELEILSPRIKWLEYIKDIFPEMTGNSTVLVTDPNYFTQLSELLTKSDEKTLNQYAMWRLADDFASDLPWGFRKAHKTFKKAYTGQKQVETRQKYCLEKVSSAFGYEIGARFVEKYMKAGDKKKLNHMIDLLKRELSNSINESDWLDAATKREAKQKLSSMRFEMGYPDLILDRGAVNNYYSDFLVGDYESFFELLRSYYKKEVSLMKQAYHGTIVAEDWNMQIYETNAFHNPVDNVIVFPAGMLQRPFYDHQVPRYINYGSIGSILGHEMIHGFNGIGAMYSNGMLSAWWPEDGNMSNCVASYYSKQTVDGHKVNGVNTANEDVADIEGLKVALHAYRNSDTHGDPRMPGLALDNNKLFFLAFAQSYCKKRRKDLIPSYLNTTMHTIENIRVLGTLSQVPEFAQTFQCGEKSPLNPKHRCSLWKQQ